MSWNHRIMRDEDGCMSIREVFYDEDGEVSGWTGPMDPYGAPDDFQHQTGLPGGDDEALASLKHDIARFQAAFCFLVLDESELIKKAKAKSAKTKTKKEKLKKNAE